MRSCIQLQKQLLNLQQLIFYFIFRLMAREVVDTQHAWEFGRREGGGQFEA